MILPDPRAGYPDYEKARIDKFIPQVWEAKITEKLFEKLHHRYPRLEWNWSGTIDKLGDAVFFRPPHSNRGIISVVAEKDVRFDTYIFDSVPRIQSDIRLLLSATEDIAEKLTLAIELPLGPAYFCGRVISQCQNHPDMYSMIQNTLIYGYKSVDLIRVATEIIGRCHARGMSVDQIQEELCKEFPNERYNQRW